MEVKLAENARVIAWYQQFIRRIRRSRRSVRDSDPITRFALKDFLGTWNQVATSRSTSFFYTGTGLTNVQATYGIDLTDKSSEPLLTLGALHKNPIVTVLNTATAPNGKKLTINGTSVARDVDLLTCRTVTFPFNPYGPPSPPGNYWILYITEDRQTIIVGAPLIVEDCLIHANFAVYILTKKPRAEYWADRRLVQHMSDICSKFGFTKCWNQPVRTD